MADDAVKKGVRDLCNDYWVRRYPDVKMPQTYFLWWYRQAARPGGMLLDVGCSDGGSVDHSKEAPAMTAVGADVDFEALKRNTFVKYKVVASADALPFRDGVFDLVTAQYVIEHLGSPEKSFSEFSRVSRPGAYFIYMTTNAASYLGFMIKNIPRSLQGTIKKKFLKMGEEEIYPVFMKGNTRGKLAGNLVRAGFRNPDFIFVGGPFYFAFSYALFRTAVAIEKITDGKLKHLKFYIIGKAEKDSNR